MLRLQAEYTGVHNPDEVQAAAILEKVKCSDKHFPSGCAIWRAKGWKTLALEMYLQLQEMFV